MRTTISKKALTSAINICKKEATKSSMEHQYGAVLVYRNMVISRAHNSYKKSAMSTKSKQCILCG